MADIVKALAGMFDGGDMTIFQATVDAVGDGVLTIDFNGGTFTEVPYIETGFSSLGAGGPEIGDACYVIGRKNWGLLVLGRPAPGPTRTVTTGAERLWEPHSLYSYAEASGTWSTTGLWSEQTTDIPGRTAVFTFTAAEKPAIGTSGFASASFHLDLDPVDTEGFSDHAYLTIGLVSSVGPSGVLVKMDGLSYGYSIWATSGSDAYVSIPLDWAARLYNGTAHGIYVRTDDWPMTVHGPGTLRITEL